MTATSPTLRTAYDSGCANGNRAGSAGRMYWRDGQPPVSDTEIRADAVASLAVAATMAWQEPDENLVLAREDAERLISEYVRGFKGAQQAAIEADGAGREVDRSYYQPPAAR